MDAFAKNLRALLLEQTQAYFPSETLLASILIAGLLLGFAAFLWATISLMRHGGRGLSASVMTLAGFAVAAAIGFLVVLVNRVWIFDFDPEVTAKFLILVFLGALLILFVVVVVGTCALYSKMRGPFWLGIIGLLCFASPLVYSRVIEPIVFNLHRPPWVSRVDGKLHVTLTNLKDFDYDLLNLFEDADVLQMANADVTDETLKKLENYKLLTEIDLNDTQVTDAGLAHLKNCASLKILRLANTKITDEGFRDHVLPRDWIMYVDVTGTPVTRKTLILWQQMRDDRKYVR